jgi:hypothetical protein
MQSSASKARRVSDENSASRIWRRAGWTGVVLSLAALASTLGTGHLRSHAQSPTPASTASAAPASAQSPAPGNPDKPQSATDTDAAQKQEIASESAQLLKMATALKIEVDKTNQDTLSLSVVRKAGEIEQLARKTRTGSGKS